MAAEPIAIAPSAMPRIGTVDERFQSYNIEMVEVTGGHFGVVETDSDAWAACVEVLESV